MHFNTYIDQIHLKNDGDDELFIGYLIELLDPPFKKLKRSDYGQHVDFILKIRNYERKNCFFIQNAFVFQ